MKGKLTTIKNNLFSNIKYLLTHNLYNGDNAQKLQILEIVDWNCSEKYNCPLKILNANETVELLRDRPLSFCRLGDGEIDIIEGKSIPFQKYDPELAIYLKKILEEKHSNLYVGINYYYYHDLSILNEYTRNFYKIFGYKYGKYFMSLCNKENTYIDASFNQIYQMYSTYDFENYYDRIKDLFKGKKVVVFAGSGILSKCNYSIFDKAAELLFEEGPSHSAFSDFSNILERALHYKNDCLLCFILGPTSKALVYELSNRGYCAWDIGHLTKDYNSYMMKEDRVSQNFKKFYAPD